MLSPGGGGRQEEAEFLDELGGEGPARIGLTQEEEEEEYLSVREAAEVTSETFHIHAVVEGEPGGQRSTSGRPDEREGLSDQHR